MHQMLSGMMKSSKRTNLLGQQSRKQVQRCSGTWKYKALWKCKIPVAIKMTTVQAKDVSKQVVRALEQPARLPVDMVVRTLGYFILNQEARDTLSFAIIDELGQYDLDVPLKEQNDKKQMKWVLGSGCSAMACIAVRHLDASLPVLLQLLECLTKAHQKRMFHHDFKPNSKHQQQLDFAAYIHDSRFYFSFQRCPFCAPAYRWTLEDSGLGHCETAGQARR